MGRRALRKPPSWLDVSSHLRTYDDLPNPWNSGQVFGREAPLEIEIGSGKGLFLQRAAAARPETDFLGIEIAYRYAHFTAARLAKRGLSNARVLVGDARRLFDEFLPEGCLAGLHVYFPDPWWKKRHVKRRLMTESFAGHAERTLAPGGALHFWTDVADYFEHSVALLRRCTSLEGPLPVREAPAEHDMDYRTHFERRTRKHGQPVFRAEFRKPPASSA
jgi:tRNA (guanine-N7-)-methyltransferase